MAKHMNASYLWEEGEVKLSLCLTKHHAMMKYWGVEVYLHPFLTWR
jgi:chloramphenicol O-acetyltransferase